MTHGVTRSAVHPIEDVPLELWQLASAEDANSVLLGAFGCLHIDTVLGSKQELLGETARGVLAKYLQSVENGLTLAVVTKLCASFALDDKHPVSVHEYGIELVQGVAIWSGLVDRVDLHVDVEARALYETFSFEFPPYCPALFFQPATAKIIGVFFGYADPPARIFEQISPGQEFDRFLFNLATCWREKWVLSRFVFGVVVARSGV